MEQIFSKLKFITHGEGFIDITYDLNLCVEKNNFTPFDFMDCLKSIDVILLVPSSKSEVIKFDNP